MNVYVNVYNASLFKINTGDLTDKILLTWSKHQLFRSALKLGSLHLNKVMSHDWGDVNTAGETVSGLRHFAFS